MEKARLENQLESERLWQTEGRIDWKPSANSKIARFFGNKTIFLTGATGFLGKLTVEKLLRACPDIDRIYILVRGKRGEDERSRVDKLYSDEIFSVLDRLNPKFRDKISVLPGDILLPDLGMSEQSIDIIQREVNVIFHIAATVSFDEKLTVATALNVRATRDLLKIAKGCANLQCFLHVSTAYANCHQKTIEEKFYQAPIGGDELIDLIERVPARVINAMTGIITEGWPNTYTFTKMIAEDVVKTYGEGLPNCVFRPAIVTATYREPLRSWIDNLYGMTGILVASGTGLLKTVQLNMAKNSEIVPADFVVNGMIAAAFKKGVEHSESSSKLTTIPIYTYCSSPENPHVSRDVLHYTLKYGQNFPSVQSIWCYCTIWTDYFWQHKILAIFLHLLPALAMDFAAKLTGNKPMLTKVYQKMERFFKTASNFMMTSFEFTNTNTQRLWTELDEDDQQMFPFSMRLLDWEEYHKTHALGLRVYLIKDDITTVEKGRRKWRKLVFAHFVLKTLFRLILLRILYGLVITFYNKYFITNS